MTQTRTAFADEIRRVFVVLAFCALPNAAEAQLALPGATEPAPVGAVITPSLPHKVRPHEARAVVPLAPAESTLAGKTLYLNGGKSQIAFAARDKTVDISRVLLSGTKISNSRDECQVDVSGMPLTLAAQGKAGGLFRFSMALPACPIVFDVLNGAVLVTSDPPKCEFTQADCSVVPSGLWGPQAGDLGPDQAKTIERERTQAENAVRSAYKGLVLSTKDRAIVRDFASEQAGFSSKREETCRDYIGESRHGFCGSRLTQARAAALETQQVGAQASRAARKKHGGHSAQN